MTPAWDQRCVPPCLASAWLLRIRVPLARSSVLKVQLHLVVLLWKGRPGRRSCRCCAGGRCRTVAVAVAVVHLLSLLEYSNPISSSHIIYQSALGFLSLLLKLWLYLLNPLSVSLHPRQTDVTASCRSSLAGESLGLASRTPSSLFSPLTCSLEQFSSQEGTGGQV